MDKFWTANFIKIGRPQNGRFRDSDANHLYYKSFSAQRCSAYFERYALTWQEWLQIQATNGNGLAAEVLRSTAQKQPELGAAVLTAENAEQVTLGTGTNWIKVGRQIYWTTHS